MCGGRLNKISSFLSANSNISTQLVKCGHQEVAVLYRSVSFEWSGFLTNQKNRSELTQADFCDILILAPDAFHPKLMFKIFSVKNTKQWQECFLTITACQNWNSFFLFSWCDWCYVFRAFNGYNFSRFVVKLQASLIHTKNITGSFIRIIFNNATKAALVTVHSGLISL